MMDESVKVEWVFKNICKVPFKELREDDVAAILKAFSDIDCVVEVYCSTSDTWWENCNAASIVLSAVYRVKRKVVTAQLIIPWHLIDKEWRFAAVCKSYNPKVWFFKYYPSWDDLDEPHLLGGDAVQSVMRISTNNVDVGMPSLVERPEGV